MTNRYPETSRQGLKRRTVLRGVGASMCLPWMDSLAWAEDRAARATADSGGPPRRWACVLFGNGVNRDHWWARGEGDSMELGDTLSPLKDFRRDISVLSGLRLFDKKPRNGVHWPYFTNFLSGHEISPTPVPDVAESADHLLAQKVGMQTSLPMMVVSCEKPFTGVRNGWPSIYSATVSWSSRRTPIPPETYPRQAFDRLFDTSALLHDRSVIDAVLEQTKDLRRHLGGHDRQKLDQYLSDVRGLEQRIDAASRDGRFEGWRPSLTEPNMQRPASDLPQDLADHMTLMLDLVVLAFQMDKTRVATLLLNNDLSEQRFTFLDGVTLNDIMHNISHHKNKPDKLRQYQLINQYHVEKFAYLLRRMKSIDEGSGTLLDNSMILFGSSMRDGNSHEATTLPLILAGGGGGSLTPGKVLDFTDRPDPERRLSNLHIAMMQRMGVPVKKFGNGIGPLPGIG